VTNLPILYEKLSKKIQSKYIRIALGFHPELLSEYSKYIPLMWEYLKNVKYIGEIGLDLKYKSADDRMKQIDFFQELIFRCKSLPKKILSVHSKGSEKEILSIISNDYNGVVILHWYSGSLENLRKAIYNEYYFSINFAMANSRRIEKYINLIPIEKLLIETDGPFVKLSNRPIRPKDVINTTALLAKLKGINTDRMQSILHKNFRNILKSVN